MENKTVRKIKRQVDYTLGIDVGIASAGISVLANNSLGEPRHVLMANSYVFPLSENAKSKATNCSERRGYRSQRRLIRRRKERMRRTKNLLMRSGLMTETYSSSGRIYELRYKALDSKITDAELCEILLFFAKHSGYCSTRKSDKEKENGKLLKAMSQTADTLKNYRTVGEMLYLAPEYKNKKRNTNDTYLSTFYRKDLISEVKTIFDSQRRFGNELLTKEFEDAYISILSTRRSFDMGPANPSPYMIDGYESVVGNCSLIPEELRGNKNTPTIEFFVAAQKINNLKVITNGGYSRFLTDEEKTILKEEILKLNKKSFTYNAVRKLLGLPAECRFNYQKSKTEDKDSLECVVLTNTITIFDILKDYLTEMTLEEKIIYADKIITILGYYSEDEPRINHLAEYNFSEDVLDKLLMMNPKKYANVSINAARMLLPYMWNEGCFYTDACDRAGFDLRDTDVERSDFLNYAEINETLANIPNPTVRKSVCKTLKVVNAIIEEYGNPQRINIEMAREMSKSIKDRILIDKNNAKRQKENAAIREKIKALGVLHPNGEDIIRYRLWENQQHMCMYSGVEIPIEDLFNGKTEIDHILPFSQTCDNSYNNKVLVLKTENQRKENRTPFEYMSPEQFEALKERIKKLREDKKNVLISDKKMDNLLHEHVTPEDVNSFVARNITDTQHIAVLVKDILAKYLNYNNPENKPKITIVSGKITSYMRKFWRIGTKNRNDDKHHAIDAIVIACVTNSNVKKLVSYNKVKEARFSHKNEWTDPSTGISYNYANYDEAFGLDVSTPWPHFNEEVDVFLTDNPAKYLSEHIDVAADVDYPEEYISEMRPIGVVRVGNKKVTGAFHEDTYLSAKHIDENYTIKKVSVDSLTSSQLEKLICKENDVELYKEIIDAYEELKNSTEKGKKLRPIIHPKTGNVVKTVKTKETIYVYTPVLKGKAISKNGGCARLDVFYKDEKYQFAPIYNNMVKSDKPRRVYKAVCPVEEWPEIEDEYFVCSLTPGDLVEVTSKKGFTMKSDCEEEYTSTHEFLYYTSMSGGAPQFISPNGVYKAKIGTFDKITKYDVDLLGRLHSVV